MRLVDNGLLAERAEQLAILHLTRRTDLGVAQASDEYGIDLLVNVSHDGNRTGRFFGVQAKAADEIPTSLNGVARNGKAALEMPTPDFPADLPFPLCVFVFGMDNDEGYYRWLLEPIAADGPYPQLVSAGHSVFRKLDRNALDRIINDVNLWYEARMQPA